MKRLETSALSTTSPSSPCWQVPLRLTLDALSDMYYGTDGPWVDELKTASLNELKFGTVDASTQLAVGEFFDDYRQRLHRRSRA